MATNPHDIVPAHLAVQAMRDNGYKNAAYAIVKLIDNAIQAGASEVELLCGDYKAVLDTCQILAKKGLVEIIYTTKKEIETASSLLINAVNKIHQLI